MGPAMRLEVLVGERLAATFVYGQEPVYYGTAGRQVAARLAVETAPSATYLLAHPGGVSTADRERWVGAVLDAGLREAGFTLRCSRQRRGLVLTTGQGPLAASSLADLERLLAQNEAVVDALLTQDRITPLLIRTLTTLLSLQAALVQLRALLTGPPSGADVFA